MNVPSAEAASKLDVRCYFVRKRNALAVRANFSGMFMDYYLHLLQIGEKHAPDIDAMLKDALVAVTLHCASRPWNERHAWTVNFQDPLANFFVTADNNTSCVTGRVFTEGVRRAERNVFYAQAQKAQEEPRMSAIEIDGTNFLRATEQFYQRSEQRVARFFEHGEEDFVFITAQPQCDVEWLEGLTEESIRQLDKEEELSLLEERTYHWECGCTIERIYQVLSPHVRQGMEELFEGDEFLKVTCPRCGMVHRVHREQFEAWLEDSKNPAT
ncbi:MAG: disulfide bond chaperone [Verrucomicrobiaceae bacterium]|nr:MAG: disulfide bond chaperone [Verrucomicrobiaceae bacterium]